MKYKPKNAKSAILIIVIVLALLFAARYFGIGTFRNAFRVGFADTGGTQNWAASYWLLSGNLEHKLRPAADQDKLYIAAKTDGGSISIDVKDSNGNSYYSEENITDEYFSIDVDINGDVTIVVSGKMHRGSFEFAFTPID